MGHECLQRLKVSSDLVAPLTFNNPPHPHPHPHPLLNLLAVKSVVLLKEEEEKIQYYPLLVRQTNPANAKKKEAIIQLILELHSRFNKFLSLIN